MNITIPSRGFRASPSWGRILCSLGFLVAFLAQAPPGNCQTQAIPEYIPAVSTPSIPAPQEISIVPQNGSTGGTPTQNKHENHHRLKLPASELSPDDKTNFEKKFVEKIKPAVERWCKVYDGHVPFRLEELTPDTLKERFGDDPSFHDYGFVINGTTLSVVDYHGEVFVAYLTSPAAAQLLQIPRNPEPPKAVSISKEEILRLLKADSGKDFPASQIAMRPTAYAGAMNGGISVDVGEGVNAAYAPLFDYSMVFGPDGNLVCYLRKIAR